MNNIENNGVPVEEGAENLEQKTPATYTEEEVQALLQREADRRVSDALKKQEQKYNQQLKESEKLKDMDENQRRQYEFEQKMNELQKREAEFNLTQNKLEAGRVLSKRNLPLEFVDYIVAEDADTMLENINAFEKAFKAAVNDAVSSKIAAPTPKNGGVTQKGITADSFKKMNVEQRSELYRTNPALYKELAENN